MRIMSHNLSLQITGEEEIARTRKEIQRLLTEAAKCSDEEIKPTTAQQTPDGQISGNRKAYEQEVSKSNLKYLLRSGSYGLHGMCLVNTHLTDVGDNT